MNWFRRLMGWPEHHHIPGYTTDNYVAEEISKLKAVSDGLENDVREPKVEEDEVEQSYDDEQLSELDTDYPIMEEVQVMEASGVITIWHIYDGDFSILANYEYCKKRNLYYNRPVPKEPRKNYVSTGRAIKINGVYKEIFRDLKMPEEIEALIFPRKEYYLDNRGRMQTHHALRGTSLLYSHSYMYNEEENVFHNPGHGSLKKYLEYKDMINKPAFKRHLEDVCDLRCPRDCECWEDRHPHVMAAYETPTGPKGNTDLDECDCLSCGVETLTDKETQQSKALAETWIVDNPLCMPSRVWNVVDVPEPKSNWVRIARMEFGEKVSNEYMVALKGELVPFTLRDPCVGEFRPLHRYYAPRNGFTDHVVTTSGEFEAIVRVDDNQNVVDISVKGETVDEISLPSNHVFFTHVHVKVPASEVL